MSLLDEIPGYREAVERETFLRDAAFLPVKETVAGFEVQPMTFRHYLMLRAIGSPLLGSGTPSPLDLTRFLWIVSPDYTPENGRAKKRFLKRCRAFTPPEPPNLFRFKWRMDKYQEMTIATTTKAIEIIGAVRQYVDEAFIDKPSSVEGGSDVSYYSDACNVCAVLGREFGWSVDQTLSEPIKRVMQFLKEAKLHHNPKAVLFNRSGKKRADWLASLPENSGRN